MLKFLNKNNRGFTLLEVMVALFIVIVGVAAGLALALSSLLSINRISKSLLAANLARESVEVIRNFRDSNWLQGLAWNNGFMVSPVVYKYTTDFNPGTGQWTRTPIVGPMEIKDCDQCKLYYNTSTGVFNHTYVPGDQEETFFRRMVTLGQICWESTSGSYTILDEAGDECKDYPDFLWVGLKVKSEVQWTISNQTRQVIIEDRLFNWR